jgi:hypothetical protein
VQSGVLDTDSMRFSEAARAAVFFGDRIRILLAASIACELADVSNFDEDLDAGIGKPGESDPSWQSLETSSGPIANDWGNHWLGQNGSG